MTNPEQHKFKSRLRTIDKPKPNCKTCGNADESCKTIERKYRNEDYPCDKYEPASVPRATEEKNTLDIKPETGVKNSKDVGQPLEQPNPELMIVKTIQGLMSTTNNQLDKLNELTKLLSCHRNSLVRKALEEINLFEKTTLFELQRSFE